MTSSELKLNLSENSCQAWRDLKDSLKYRNELGPGVHEMQKFHENSNLTFNSLIGSLEDFWRETFDKSYLLSEQIFLIETCFRLLQEKGKYGSLENVLINIYSSLINFIVNFKLINHGTLKLYFKYLKLSHCKAFLLSIPKDNREETLESFCQIMSTNTTTLTNLMNCAIQLTCEISAFSCKDFPFKPILSIIKSKGLENRFLFQVILKECLDLHLIKSIVYSSKSLSIQNLIIYTLCQFILDRSIVSNKPPFVLLNILDFIILLFESLQSPNLNEYFEDNRFSLKSIVILSISSIIDFQNEDISKKAIFIAKLFVDLIGSDIEEFDSCFSQKTTSNFNQIIIENNEQESNRIIDSDSEDSIEYDEPYVRFQSQISDTQSVLNYSFRSIFEELVEYRHSPESHEEFIEFLKKVHSLHYVPEDFKEFSLPFILELINIKIDSFQNEAYDLRSNIIQKLILLNYLEIIPVLLQLIITSDLSIISKQHILVWLRNSAFKLAFGKDVNHQDQIVAIHSQNYSKVKFYPKNNFLNVSDICIENICQFIRLSINLDSINQFILQGIDLILPKESILALSTFLRCSLSSIKFIKHIKSSILISLQLLNIEELLIKQANLFLINTIFDCLLEYEHLYSNERKEKSHLDTLKTLTLTENHISLSNNIFDDPDFLIFLHQILQERKIEFDDKVCKILKLEVIQKIKKILEKI